MSISLGSYDAETFLDGRLAVRAEYKPGCCQIVAAGRAPRGVFDGPWRLAQICISQDEMAGLAELPAAQLELADPAGVYDPVLYQWAVRALEEAADPATFTALYRDAMRLELCAHLLRRWLVCPSPHAARSAGSRFHGDWRIRRTLDDLEDRLASNVRLEALAAVVDLKPRHYTTLFRTATGLPPHAWVMKRRVERACQMLRDPRRAITDIAAELGFASSQHFATVFRRRMGMAPTAYRREMAR